MELQLLMNEAKRTEEDLLWSKTANFQIATWWRFLHWVIGVPAVICAAATGVVAVKTGHPDLTAALAVISAILSGLTTFVNPSRAAREFHNAGVRMAAVHDRVRRFHEIDCVVPDANYDSLRKALEKLANDKAHLNETTPHIGGLAYWLAQRSINRDQHTHEVDK